MRTPQGPTGRPKPKSKTPSERADELQAVQIQLKQQAADRRAASEKNGKRPAVALSSQARGGNRRTP